MLLLVRTSRSKTLRQILVRFDKKKKKIFHVDLVRDKIRFLFGNWHTDLCVIIGRDVLNNLSTYYTYIYQLEVDIVALCVYK